MISELRHKYKLEGLLEITSVPRSTFYYNNSKLNKPDKYEKVKKMVVFIIEKTMGAIKVINRDTKQVVIDFKHKTEPLVLV